MSGWRKGYTSGGALGIWLEGSKTDEPDVCTVAAVPDEQDIARANLIAAAPDLLEAAEALLKRLDSMEPHEISTDHLRAVITKATS